MRWLTRKSYTKWLSVEAVTAKRLYRRLECKRDRSEIDRLDHVLPVAMQMDTLTIAQRSHAIRT